MVKKHFLIFLILSFSTEAKPRTHRLIDVNSASENSGSEAFELGLTARHKVLIREAFKHIPISPFAASENDQCLRLLEYGVITNLKASFLSRFLVVPIANQIFSLLSGALSLSSFMMGYFSQNKDWETIGVALAVVCGISVVAGVVLYAFAIYDSVPEEHNNFIKQNLACIIAREVACDSKIVKAQEIHSIIKKRVDEALGKFCYGFGSIGYPYYPNPKRLLSEVHAMCKKYQALDTILNSRVNEDMGVV
jgi:hypothetical protein